MGEPAGDTGTNGLTGRSLLARMRATWVEFGQDGGPRLSAAMAYYVLFVMAPALLLITNLAARFVGSESGEFAHGAIEELLGEELAGYLIGLATSVAEARADAAVSVVGTIALLWAVAVFYLNTQHVLNRMWRVQVKSGAPWQTVAWTRLKRFTAMLLPIVALAATTLTNTVAEWLHELLGTGLLGGLLEAAVRLLDSPVAVFGMAWLSFTMLYAFLPDAKVRWRVAVIAALAVAMGWTLGSWAFGRYLGWSSGGFAFGAASAVFVLLIWLNYSSQLVLLGCKLTKVWTEAEYGRVEPLPHAVVIRVEADTDSGTVLPAEQ